MISSILSEGDFIKIFFNNSNKSVEGYIFKLLPTSIAIKTLEGKLCGIKGDDIDYFVEGTLSNTTNVDTFKSETLTDSHNILSEKDEEIIVMDNSSKKEDSCNDSVQAPSPNENSVNSETIQKSSSDQTPVNEDSTEDQSKVNPCNYKAGDVIPLDTLHKIDPELRNINKKSSYQKKSGVKMSTLGNDFSALNVLVKDKHEIDDLKIVPALGEIKFVKPEMNFGFINDGKSGQDLYFNLSQIIDKNVNSGSWYHQAVVYSLQTDAQGKGPKAVTIHKPRTISEMIKLASEFSNSGEYKHAFHLIEQILSEYPDNFSADILKKELSKRFPQYNSKYKEYSADYSKAKKFHLKKDYNRAIACYLSAIEKGQKLYSSIKDLGMLYAEKFKVEVDDSQKEQYKKTAISHINKYRNELPDSVSTLYYLENFYYSLGNFEDFLKVCKVLLEENDVISSKAKSLNILYKMAMSYIQLNRTDDAQDIIDEALEIDPFYQPILKLEDAMKENSSAKDIIAAISATEFESLNSGLSTFIQQTLQDYDEYAGVKTKDIESKNFTQATLKDVREVIEKAGAARARERANYLLTEGKLMLDLEPAEELRLRIVMARYCNAMALSHISDNSSMDVIRFFYNEAFNLEEKWDSNVRQIALYLLTHIHNYTELISDSGKNNSIDGTLDVLFNSSVDTKYWDSILTMMLYNTSISAQITSRLYSKPEWKDKAVRALTTFGVSDLTTSLSQSDFGKAWNLARENRLREYQKVVATIKTTGNSSSIEEVVWNLYEVNKRIVEEWVCPLDRRRISSITNSVAPSIDSYIKSSGYRNKETNYNNANAQIQQLIDEIKEGPTKLSYDAILPLMESVLEMLNASFSDIVKMSEPKISIKLLSSETVVDEDNMVSIQVSIENHKDSSPIREVGVSVESSNDVAYVEDNNVSYNAIEGGDCRIFKLRVKVSDNVLRNKATALDTVCHYKSGSELKSSISKLSLKLYSPNEYQPIDNPYAPIADGGPVPEDSNMFYGRDEFIQNLSDAIIKSPSKQVIIYGQKRCGKSSVLLHLRKKLKETGKAFCVSFSMGEIINNLTESSFYHKILSTIKNELDFLELDSVDVPSFEIPSYTDFTKEDPANPLNTFSKYIVRFKHACKKSLGWENKNLVVMIDEFTYVYTEIKKGRLNESLMKQWKAVTQNDRAQFSVVLVGQDVVPSFKNEDYAKNAFGVIQDIRLTYLQEEPARDLIERPIINTDGSSRYIGNAVSRIIDYTSRNPYYIQIFCSRLVEYMNRNKSISVTEADVDEVAKSFVYGVEALPEDKFDNLIRAGESEDLQEYPEAEILQVLRQIAINSKNIGFCNQTDINALEDKQREKDILKHLTEREVLEQKGENSYKIQVKLFQEWLLNH